MSPKYLIGVSLMMTIAMGTLITTISASVPGTAPSGVTTNVQGLFATYFQNMVETPCDFGYVVSGFSSDPTNYGTKTCVSMSGTLTSIYPTLFDVTWLKSGTNISYTGGNVGIGTASPTAKLEIVGNMKLTDGSQGVGKILTSDANGLASWMVLTNNLPSAFIGQTLRYDGSTWVANSNIYDNGLNVGIGTLSPLYKLEVAGKIGSYTTLSTDNDNTVTTKNYVDGRLAGLCTAMGGTWNNTTGVCTAAVTYSWQLGTTYGACSVTCGGGTQTAPAVCKQNNGTIVADALCAGAKPAATSQSCNIQACAPVVNGSCNNSTQYACSAGTSTSNVAGSCGGSSTWSCLGSGGGTNATNCNIANAACVPVVNGGWSAWGGGSCSVSCGGGTMTQTRTCNNPVPSGGGANCVGSSTQSISCNTQSCVVAVNGSCGGSANTCGAGSPSGYSAGSCGGSQTWSCLGSGGGSSASCNIANAACPLSCTHPGGTVYWGSCSAYVGATTIVHGGSAGPFANTAGGYVGSATYGCNNGNFTISSTCNPAPVDGGWSAITNGPCSVSCGGGTLTRTRTCTNPTPANGGAACSGPSSDVQACNTQACPYTISGTAPNSSPGTLTCNPGSTLVSASAGCQYPGNHPGYGYIGAYVVDSHASGNGWTVDCRVSTAIWPAGCENFTWGYGSPPNDQCWYGYTRDENAGAATLTITCQ